MLTIFIKWKDLTRFLSNLARHIARLWSWRKSLIYENFNLNYYTLIVHSYDFFRFFWKCVYSEFQTHATWEAWYLVKIYRISNQLGNYAQSRISARDLSDGIYIGWIFKAKFRLNNRQNGLFFCMNVIMKWIEETK